MKSDKNKKGKKKETKKEKGEEPQLSGMTFAMGQMDLIFEITFDDKDLENPESKSDEDKYFKIEDMKTIKDLSFLKDKNEEFLNTIKLKPNNEFIKQLLLGNKISKKKVFIDLNCYGRPKFEGEEEFFDKIFEYVTVKNYLQINKTPLEEGSRHSILIQLKHKNNPEQTSEIKVGTTPSEEKEKKEKEEADKKEEEENKKKEKEEEDKKEMEEKKKQKIQLYKERREKAKKKKEEKDKKENEEEKEGGENNERDKNNEKQNSNNKEQNKDENNEDNSEENEEEEEPEDYEETDAMKEKKLPKFKRKNILCNLNPSCTKYDLIYLNYEDISKIPGDFKMKYLIELLEHFKKKKSTIFINFYKNEPTEEEKTKEEDKQKEEEKKKEETKKEEKKNEETKKEEEEKKKREKKLKDINDKKQQLLKRQKDLKDNKKNEIKEMEEEEKTNELNTIKTELENLDEEEQNINDEIRAEEEVKKEYKRKKEKEQKEARKKQEKKNKKEMRELNEIFFFTDGYFFDTKQACELFNNHYLCHTTDNKKNQKVINKQKVFDYFITAIARGATDEVQGNKIGLFMEDFNKYTFIYCSKKTAYKKELNAQPHPKINPHNVNLIKIYQDIIKNNKNDYYSIVSCLPPHEICAVHNISPEIVYTSFLITLEIIKRKLECEINKIAINNDDQIYRVKMNEKALQQELEKLTSDFKEGGFILDCTNKSKSTLKDYVALYDYHLRGFFSSQLIRKYLKDKGFIDSKGFIMYDPVYRNVMGAQSKNKKKYEGDELKEKIISNIKGIDIHARMKDKEIDAKKASEKQNKPLDKKLHFVKDIEPKKQNKKKNKKKKPGSVEGNSSSGGSSDDENKSGEDSSSGSEDNQNS